MCSESADAGHICQVHARNAKQLSLQIKRWLVACALIDTFFGSGGPFLGRSFGTWKFLHSHLEFLIDLSHEPPIEAIGVQRLAKRK
jgi:hypothetical protein